MNDEEILSKPRHRAGPGKQQPVVQYTDKDFQLEVLGKLAETLGLAESLQDSLRQRQSETIDFCGSMAGPWSPSEPSRFL